MDGTLDPAALSLCFGGALFSPDDETTQTGPDELTTSMTEIDVCAGPDLATFTNIDSVVIGDPDAIPAANGTAPVV